jgi:pimeloyl-ACP methyl ester carboxylesterase
MMITQPRERRSWSRIIITGNSLGGGVAQVFAAEYPQACLVSMRNVGKYVSVPFPPARSRHTLPGPTCDSGLVAEDNRAVYPSLRSTSIRSSATSRRLLRRAKSRRVEGVLPLLGIPVDSRTSGIHAKGGRL